MKASEIEPRNHKLLLDHAGRCRCNTGKLDLPWRIFQKDPTDDTVCNELIQLNRESGNTVALSRVFQRRIELKPTDDLAKNNLAFLSLLLNTNLAQAFRLRGGAVLLSEQALQNVTLNRIKMAHPASGSRVASTQEATGRSLAGTGFSRAFYPVSCIELLI